VVDFLKLQAENKINFLRYSILSVEIPQLLTLLLRKNYHFGCSGGPWRLGALGLGPPGPLDKMALLRAAEPPPHL